MWHSCGRYRLADHFARRPAKVRALFDAWRRFVRRCGPFTVYAQKTRIVFMTRARFSGAVVRGYGIQAGLWLKRRAEHPLFERIEYIPPGNWVHHFRLTDASQLDAALFELVRECYAVGGQLGPGVAGARGPASRKAAGVRARRGS